MRSLSTFNLTAIDKPYVDSILLVEIELSGLTLFLCDRAFGSGATECVFDGQLYEPIITSVGSSNHGAIESVNYKSKAGKFSFVVDNTVTIGPADYFSKLFLLYSFYYATVSAFQIYEGATAGDKITRFKGLIENHSDMTQSEIEITCAGPELSLPDNFLHDIVDDAAYPGAAPDDLGKMLPQVYGSAKRVPLISIDAGSITTLAADITDTDVTIPLSDSSKFPTYGTIQIDLEQITYTNNSGNLLTGCLRGQNTTTAVSHLAAAMIGEVQSSYWYVLGHAVNAINAVYVDGVRQIGNYTAYTGQAGDSDPSGLYDGLACIRFDVLPLIIKQINVEIDEGDHEHDSISYPISSWKMDTVWITGGFVASLEQLVDDNFISGAHFFGTGAVNYQKTIGEQLGGTGPLRGQLGFVIHSNPNSHNCRCYFPYLGDMYRSSVGIHRGGWQDISGLTWNTFLALTGIVRNYHPADGSAAQISIFMEVEFDDASASSPATGVALSGDSVADTVIGGIVAIDVDGYQDDGAGTYTGTPDALIERPDHIMKHVLIDRCGKVAGDIDSTSYTASGNAYGLAGYNLGIALLAKPDTRKLMYDIATQSRSIEFWESGVHHLVHVPGTAEAVDKTLDSRINLDSITIRPANRVNIKNKLSATYDKEWSGKGEEESEQAVVVATSPDSIAKYGTLEADKFSFPYITNATQAQEVLNWLRDNRKDTTILLDFIAGHHLMDLEKGDIVQFTFVVGDQLDKAFLGLISTDGTFRLIDVSYENENTKLVLETGTAGLTPAFNLIGFNPAGGTYDAFIDVALTTAVVDGDIYYTTDGSDPDTGDTLYSTPIAVTEDVTIKARLYVNAVASGPIQTEVYNIEIEDYWNEVAPQFESESSIRSMAVFNGKLYAGTSPGGKLLEWNGLNAWVEVADTLVEGYCFALQEYNGKLYGAMGINNGCLYEWNGVDAWVEVAPMLDGETRIQCLCVYNGKLYGGTYSHGRLYEWNDSNAWVEKAPMLGSESNIVTLLEFNSKLYGGTFSGGRLYEWNDVDLWVEKAGNLNSQFTIYGLTIFDGDLYAGTQPGCRLFRWNGTNAWVQEAGQFESQTYVSALIVNDSKLYGGAGGPDAQLIKWDEISAWVEASGPAGDGEYIIALVEFNGRIYAGTVSEGALYEYFGTV